MVHTYDNGTVRKKKANSRHSQARKRKADPKHSLASQSVLGSKL